MFGARWTLIGGGAATLVAVLAATVWLVKAEEIHVKDIHIRADKVAA